MDQDHRQDAIDLAAELQNIYDSEINIELSWLWDGGVEVRLGDRLNGFVAETNVPVVADIIPWLQEAIAHFYPDSAYANNLPTEVRERAAATAVRPTNVRRPSNVSALRRPESEPRSNGGDHRVCLLALRCRC